MANSMTVYCMCKHIYEKIMIISVWTLQHVSEQIDTAVYFIQNLMSVVWFVMLFSFPDLGIFS
jgi:hypothetical protein